MLGVREPGNSPSSSSRGENPRPTGQACPVTAFQFDPSLLMGEQPAYLLPPALQPASTLRTPGATLPTLMTYCSRLAGQGYLLYQLGSRFGPKPVHRRFNLGECCLGMLLPPFPYLQHHPFRRWGGAPTCNCQLLSTPSSHIHLKQPYPRSSRPSGHRGSLALHWAVHRRFNSVSASLLPSNCSPHLHPGSPFLVHWFIGSFSSTTSPLHSTLSPLYTLPRKSDGHPPLSVWLQRV